MTTEVKMVALRELHCDSWSGLEYGSTFYFRCKEEALTYKQAYSTQNHKAASAPEYYKTYEYVGEVWVKESELRLKEDSYGLFCELVV